MSKSSQKSKSKSICDQVPKKESTSKPTELPKTDTKNAPLLEFPHFLRKIGPNHIKTMMQFLPSAMIWSVAGVLGVMYVTEWQAILRFLPYYNGKYVEETDVKEETEEADQPQK